MIGGSNTREYVMRQTGERSLGLGPFGEVLTVTSFIVTRLHPHLSLKLRKSSVCNMREAPCADFDCDEIKCVIRFCCSCMLPLMQKPWQTNSTTDIPIFMHMFHRSLTLCMKLKGNFFLFSCIGSGPTSVHRWGVHRWWQWCGGPPEEWQTGGQVEIHWGPAVIHLKVSRYGMDSENVASLHLKVQHTPCY